MLQTPARMEELVLLESILSLVTALLVTLENCVRQISMSVLLTPAKMEELVLMESILSLAIVLLVILEPYVMLQVCPLANDLILQSILLALGHGLRQSHKL